jgi:hypothetical protein
MRIISWKILTAENRPSPTGCCDTPAKLKVAARRKRSSPVMEHAGIRTLLTHPIDDDAEAFYRRFGFESTPAHDRHLILLLKDARHVAGALQ